MRAMTSLKETPEIIKADGTSAALAPGNKIFIGQIKARAFPDWNPKESRLLTHLLTRQEDDDVPLLPGVVDVEEQPEGRLEGVPVAAAGVHGLGAVPARRSDHGDAATETLQGPAHVGGSEQHQPQLCPGCQHSFQQAEQGICCHSPFVHIIQDNDSVRVQKRRGHHFPLEHLICAVPATQTHKTLSSVLEYRFNKSIQCLGGILVLSVPTRKIW